MEKSNTISDLLERLEALENWRKEKVKRKEKKTPAEDEEVCPQCGGDLLFVEDGIVFCKKCNEYFEMKVEE